MAISAWHNGCELFERPSVLAERDAPVEFLLHVHWPLVPRHRDLPVLRNVFGNKKKGARCWYSLLVLAGTRCWYSLLVFAAGTRCWYSLLVLAGTKVLAQC